jgi:hypothetical protein
MTRKARQLSTDTGHKPASANAYHRAENIGELDLFSLRHRDAPESLAFI